jgi:hypothetical protein
LILPHLRLRVIHVLQVRSVVPDQLDVEQSSRGALKDSQGEETHSELPEPDSGNGPKDVLSSEPGSWDEEYGSEKAYQESNNFSVGSVVGEHFNLLGQGLAVYSR